MESWIDQTFKSNSDVYFVRLYFISNFIYIYHHHHHHIVLAARISLTLSRHSSLSFIALGRSSGQHPVSSHSCWMYVRDGRPAFARPCVGIHKSTSSSVPSYHNPYWSSISISSVKDMKTEVRFNQMNNVQEVLLNCGVTLSHRKQDATQDQLSGVKLIWIQSFFFLQVPLALPKRENSTAQLFTHSCRWKR